MTDFNVSMRLLVIASLAAGCGGSTDAPPTESAAPPAASPPPAAAPAPSASGEQIVAPGAVFAMPDGWVRQQPASQMRLAQAQIPGPGGPGELTVFFFGPGGGGGTEANLQRWIGQVEAEGEAMRESFTLGTWKVTWIDVAGILKPSSMGVGPTDPQPGSRLLGAVVEGEGGPWVFKATGPSETLESQREAFHGMLKSGRPHP